MIGAGGYVCGPTLLAAKLLGIKIYIIEQNAVAGVTNKLLSKISNKIFVNFKDTKGLSSSGKVVVAGNPVRSGITYSENTMEEALKILVFGGSLGAAQINSTVKSLVGKDWKTPVSIVHQVGKGNLEEYQCGHNVKYEQKEYLESMDKLYRWANIIIARAGASTISELRIARRASILIPFPFATDNHQEHNARELKDENAFFVSVIDQTSSAEEIEKALKATIDEITAKGLFKPFKTNEIPDSSGIIFKEVLKDVRN